MKIERIRPEEIERRSFEIITDLLGEQQPPDETAHIVKRVIHTTADLEYAETLYFSENAAQILSQALAEGCPHCYGYANGSFRHQQKNAGGIWRASPLLYGGRRCCPPGTGKRGYPGLCVNGKSCNSFCAADFCHRQCADSIASLG